MNVETRRAACLVYNAVDFAFFHRLFDVVRRLRHRLRDLLCGVGGKTEDEIFTVRRKKEQPVSTACGFYKVKQYNHQKKVTVNITTTDVLNKRAHRLH